MIKVLLFLKTWVFCVLMILAGLVLILIIPVVFLNLKWSMTVGKFYFTIFNFLLKVCCGITFSVEGEENIPKGENFIVAAKHVSAWETFFFAWYFYIPVYIVKRSLFLIPCLGWYMKRCGMVGIDRQNRITAMEQISKASKDVVVGQKRNLIIFPQGTRTPIGPSYSVQKYPYKKGILSMCANLPKVKVLLVTNNSVKYFGRNFFSLKKPGTIIVRFMPCIQKIEKSGLNFLKEIQTKIESETIKIL